MTNVRVIQNGGTDETVVKGFYNHLLFAMFLFCFCLFVSLFFLTSGVTFFSYTAGVKKGKQHILNNILDPNNSP